LFDGRRRYGARRCPVTFNTVVNLRPVDLARAAGISAQQVRNYADAGILPPAERSPAGYRRFDERHRLALLTYRALAAGHGRPAAQRVMLLVHAGDVPAALALLDAGHAELHAGRESLRATGTALAAVAEQSWSPARAEPTGRADRVGHAGLAGRAGSQRGLRIGELARVLGVRTSALRVWEDAGLLAPDREAGTGYRVYGPAEVRDARMIHMLRQSYYPLPQIAPILEGLRRTGSSEELRAAIARRQDALHARSAAMLAAATRLHAYLGQTDGA
jgi:DNA-binding transcriptional MerR regulator